LALEQQKMMIMLLSCKIKSSLLVNRSSTQFTQSV